MLRQTILKTALIRMRPQFTRKLPFSKKFHTSFIRRDPAPSNLFTPSWTPIRPRTDLEQIGCNRAVLDSLSDIVLYLQDPEAFTKSGITAPKGVILSGPPGVGKTMMAEAIAGQAGVPIIMISGPEIESPYVGVSQINLRNLFDAAKKNAPCVLCVDEIDAIATKRFSSIDNSHAHAINSKVNQLLSLLSKENTGVIVIGTTNNYQLLDSAIVRPGRFDKHIYLPLPDFNDRVTILKIHTQSKKLDHSISLSNLSKLSAGFSGAKIAAWVNEAALYASREKSNVITALCFDKARTRLQNGVSSLPQTDINQLENTAIHELGHALVGHHLGLKIYIVSTFMNDQSVGTTEFLNDKETHNHTKQQFLNKICIALAGRAAELSRGFEQSGNTKDLDRAKEIAIHMVKEEGMGTSLIGRNYLTDAEIILEQQLIRAKNILQSYKKEFDLLTRILVERGELMGEEFLDVLSGKPPTFIFNPANTSSFFGIPPKKEYKPPRPPQPIGHPSEPKSKNEHPFTIDEVEKALKVKPGIIRRISSGFSDSCKIYFKPSFDENDHMKEMSKVLAKNNVEHFFMPERSSSQPYLEIYKDGYLDFVAFIKKENSLDANNNSLPSRKP